MPAPPDHQGATSEIDRVLDGIDNLTPRERERLYLRLLYGRPLPPPVAMPASVLSNPATVLASRVVEPTRRPVEVRTYLAESGIDPAETLAMPRASPQRPPVELRIFDLHGQYSILGANARRSIVQHLMKIDDWAGDAGSFEVHGIQFAVELSGDEPSAAVKAAFAPRATPVYILNETRVGFDTVSRILKEHQYPEFIPGSARERSLSRAEKEWRGGILGVTLPKHVSARANRFVRCIFLQGDRLWAESHKNVTYISNVIIHELGHALGVFGGRAAHPTDGSVMQTRVDFAGMSTALRPFNRRHATVLRSYVNLLSRAVVLLAIALSMFGCAATTVHPSQCRAIEVEGQDCHSCSESSSLSPGSAARLAREILARAISADRKERAFIGTSDGPRFYRVNGGAMRIPGVETVEDIDDLNEAAKAEPWKDLVFVDIEVLGASGDDSIYVRVTVTPRSWMPDYGRFGDDPGTGTYCLQWVDNTVRVTVITPPIYLSERGPRTTRRA